MQAKIKKNLQKNIKEHWLAIILVVVGTFLRTYQLDEKAIFFGDSARDILVAVNSVENKTIPLLGIPSSRPEFKQGPVSIWIIMILYKFFGLNLFAFSIVFAGIGTSAMIVLYEFCLTFLNKFTGQISLALLAFSPLAIAHSRMVYHIVPIPVILLLSLTALINFWKNKKLSAFWASLNLAVLFQFELSLVPFFLLIPYILWKKKRKINLHQFFQIMGGFILGLLPQIIFDFKHKFAQLGAFFKWMTHQSLLFFIPGKSGFTIIERAQVFSEKYWTYFGRIWGTDTTLINIVMTVVLTISLVQIYKKIFRSKKSTSHAKNYLTQEIIFISTALLSLGYFVNGSPSEAYFSPYLILIPLLIAMGVNLTSNKIKHGFLVFTIFLGILNARNVFAHNFFVSNPQNFQYGPSTGEQKKVVEHILTTSEKGFILKTQGENKKFKSFLDGYRYLTLESGGQENKNGQVFYIEKRGDLFGTNSEDFSKIKQVNFETISVYQLKK